MGRTRRAAGQCPSKYSGARTPDSTEDEARNAGRQAEACGSPTNWQHLTPLPGLPGGRSPGSLQHGEPGPGRGRQDAAGRPQLDKDGHHCERHNTKGKGRESSKSAGSRAAPVDLRPGRSQLAARLARPALSARHHTSCTTKRTTCSCCVTAWDAGLVLAPPLPPCLAPLLTCRKDLQHQNKVHQNLDPRPLEVEHEQQALRHEGKRQEGLQWAAGRRRKV